MRPRARRRAAGKIYYVLSCRPAGRHKPARLCISCESFRRRDADVIYAFFCVATPALDVRSSSAAPGIIPQLRTPGVDFTIVSLCRQLTLSHKSVLQTQTCVALPREDEELQQF